jgi:hypothetical protein
MPALQTHDPGRPCTGSHDFVARWCAVCPVSLRQRMSGFHRNAHNREQISCPANGRQRFLFPRLYVVPFLTSRWQKQPAHEW